MRLYHGSNIIIENIDLSKCRPYKDFGQGFYLTTLLEQAQKMAQRVSRIYGGNPMVTVFDFDEKLLSSTELKARLFDSEKPSAEWALFVSNNRKEGLTEIESTDCNQDLRYDIVVGPVANDDLALLFRQFSNGFIDLEGLKKGMEYKKLTDQYSFHTEKAISFLKKIGEIHG